MFCRWTEELDGPEGHLAVPSWEMTQELYSDFPLSPLHLLAADSVKQLHFCVCLFLRLETGKGGVS